jgi:hypothetical protein
MKHSPSWEAYASLTRQETHILWNLIVHYSVYKNLVHVSELESMPSCPVASCATLKTGSHLILDLAGGIFPSHFSTKTLYIFFISIMCTMPHKSHYHWTLNRAKSWTERIGFLIIEISIGQLHWANTTWEAEESACMAWKLKVCYCAQKSAQETLSWTTWMVHMLQSCLEV